MFVCTLKWNKKTALLTVLGVALVLCVLIVVIGYGGRSNAGCKAKTNDERVEFLQSLGWEVTEEPVETRSIVIPKEFSSIYEAYNELQRSQGYDLSKYRGMEATLYTYEVLNYSGYDGHVVAELYVVNDRIVGGDVHSLELDGFMHGLSKAS